MGMCRNPQVRFRLRPRVEFLLLMSRFAATAPLVPAAGDSQGFRRKAATTSFVPPRDSCTRQSPAQERNCVGRPGRLHVVIDLRRASRPSHATRFDLATDTAGSECRSAGEREATDRPGECRWRRGVFQHGWARSMFGKTASATLA